ncbi:MAG TPA: hypothetical protein VMB91_07685 [Solirubrobacteraceae bacterium]|nr:hypothetical protein [Solirubrobacteraceae bacterium]
MKPPRPARAHYTGGYTNKECTLASASHEGEYEKLLDLSSAQEKTLTALLEHVKVEEKGDPVPYVVFSGANVQIESGAGSQTAPVNGEGNLIVGYNEGTGTQTGSNNLVLGNQQSFTSYGSILAGEANTDSVPGGVAFGYDNKVNGPSYAASVLGGEFNTASGYLSVVGGGEENTATGQEAVVSGGAFNKASAPGAFVGGGLGNAAEGNFTAILGGTENETSSPPAEAFSAIVGGRSNTAGNLAATILGGQHHTTSGQYEEIP